MSACDLESLRDYLGGVIVGAVAHRDEKDGECPEDTFHVLLELDVQCFDGKTRRIQIGHATLPDEDIIGMTIED